MSTRSTTWFVSGDLEPEAKVYRHADGYPEGHPVASDEERVSCRTCRDWLGLP